MDRKYQEVIYLWWDPRDNTFYDQHGAQLPNIFEIITPNDLFLFRNDHGYSIFPYVKDRRILCEINVLDEEELEDQENVNEGFEVFCDFWGGVSCRMHCNEDAGRKEICRACSGGD